MELQELSFSDSREFLYKFQKTEKAYGAEWYDVEESEATFIWLIEDLANPLGFLSYKIFALPESQEFLYIVKIYVLNTHRGKDALMIEGERVSEVLFRVIENKGMNILTLESSDERLDEYYKSLGFGFNPELSSMYGSIIDTRNRKIIFRNTQRYEVDLSAQEKQFFSMQQK